MELTRPVEERDMKSTAFIVRNGIKKLVNIDLFTSLLYADDETNRLTYGIFKKSVHLVVGWAS